MSYSIPSFRRTSTLTLRTEGPKQKTSSLVFLSQNDIASARPPFLTLLQLSSSLTTAPCHTQILALRGLSTSLYFSLPHPLTFYHLLLPSLSLMNVFCHCGTEMVEYSDDDRRREIYRHLLLLLRQVSPNLPDVVESEIYTTGSCSNVGREGELVLHVNPGVPFFLPRGTFCQTKLCSHWK